MNPKPQGLTPLFFPGPSCTKVRAHLWGLDLSGTLQGAGGVGGLLYSYDYATYTALFPVYDGNGNILALLKHTDGSVGARFEYDAFGRSVLATGPYAASYPFRFSTKYTDIETGLVYYGHRYYNPGLGRFINRDPIGEQGGLNLYGYDLNQTPDNLDYLGMYIFGVGGSASAGGATYVGAGAQAIFGIDQNDPRNLHGWFYGGMTHTSAIDGVSTPFIGAVLTLSWSGARTPSQIEGRSPTLGAFAWWGIVGIEVGNIDFNKPIGPQLRPLSGTAIYTLNIGPRGPIPFGIYGIMQTTRTATAAVGQVADFVSNFARGRPLTPTGPLAPGSDPAERFWLPSETPAQIEPYVVHGTRPTAAESDSYNENLRSAGFNANLTRGELYLGTNAWVADKRDPARWKASVFYQEMLYSMLAAMGPALTKAQRAEYLQAAESAKLQYQNEVWMQGLIEGVARDKDGRIE